MTEAESILEKLKAVRENANAGKTTPRDESGKFVSKKDSKEDVKEDNKESK